MPDAVDEKRRRPVHAAPHAGEEVAAHPRRIRSCFESGDEARHVQAADLRVASEIRIVQRVLILEQRVVHLPELPLRAGGFGGFRRVLGVRMNLGEREIAVDKTKAAAHDTQHFGDDGMCRAAMRTLIVAILDQRDRRVVGAQAVIVFKNGRSETAHALTLSRSIFSNASRIPSAPGLTPMGETYDQRITPFSSRTKRARSEMPSPSRYTPYERATAPFGSK